MCCLLEVSDALGLKVRQRKLNELVQKGYNLSGRLGQIELDLKIHALALFPFLYLNILQPGSHLLYRHSILEVK